MHFNLLTPNLIDSFAILMKNNCIDVAMFLPLGEQEPHKLSNIFPNELRIDLLDPLLNHTDLINLMISL